MNAKTVKQSENLMLRRKEYTLDIEFDKATPSREEIKSHVAGISKSKPELVVVKHIYSSFGDKKARATAFVYEKIEEMREVELKEKKVFEKKLADDKKAAEEAKKAADEAAAAAPAA